MNGFRAIKMLPVYVYQQQTYQENKRYKWFRMHWDQGNHPIYVKINRVNPENTDIHIVLFTTTTFIKYFLGCRTTDKMTFISFHETTQNETEA